MTTDDLDEALTAQYDLPDEGTPEREQWRITDDRQATWAARKLRGYEAERLRLVDLANEERAKIDEWLEDRTHGLIGQVAFFREHLIGYYRALVHVAGPETPKTYDVPGAKMTRRKNPDSIAIEDEEAFVSYAYDEFPKLLRLAPDKAEVKRFIEQGLLVVTPPIETDAKGKPLPSEYGSSHGLASPMPDGTVTPLPGVEYVVGEESYGVTVEP